MDPSLCRPIGNTLEDNVLTLFQPDFSFLQKKKEWSLAIKKKLDVLSSQRGSGSFNSQNQISKWRQDV